MGFSGGFLFRRPTRPSLVLEESQLLHKNEVDRKCYFDTFDSGAHLSFFGTDS